MGALLSLTLFGSVLGFWLSVLAFLIICFISDAVEEGGWAFAGMVILGGMFYFWADIKPVLEFFTLISVSTYLLAGLVFSFIRTFLAARKLGKDTKDLIRTKKEAKEQGKYTDETQEYAKDRFVDKLKGNVFRWWFMWPISLISWIATDLVVEVWDFLYSKISGFYKHIVDLGISSVK
jgi:hypothetical protein